MIVAPDFLHHWKTELLIQRTNDPASPLMLIRLWGHCQQRKQWIFENLSKEALKGICKWTGNPEELHKILLECRFIDETENGMEIHGWAEANISLISNWRKASKGGRSKNLGLSSAQAQLEPGKSWGKAIDKRRFDRGDGNEETESPAAMGSFKRFWEVYPKRVGKPDAERAFIENDCADHIDQIMATVERSKQSEMWLNENGKYIPNPANWLNRRSWEDAVPPPHKPMYHVPNI